MMIADQDTILLPVIPRPRYAEETVEQRFQRLKTFSEITGVRFCRAYHFDEQQRLKAMCKRAVPTRVLPSHI